MGSLLTQNSVRKSWLLHDNPVKHLPLVYLETPPLGKRTSPHQYIAQYVIQHTPQLYTDYDTMCLA